MRRHIATRRERVRHASSPAHLWQILAACDGERAAESIPAGSSQIAVSENSTHFRHVFDLNSSSRGSNKTKSGDAGRLGSGRSLPSGRRTFAVGDWAVESVGSALSRDVIPPTGIAGCRGETRQLDSNLPSKSIGWWKTGVDSSARRHHRLDPLCLVHCPIRPQPRSTFSSQVSSQFSRQVISQVP